MSARTAITALVLVVVAAPGLRAQDTTVQRIPLGVVGFRVGQPNLVVLAGRGLDSVRTIVQRDLENSDRYTIPHLTDTTGTLSAPFDPRSLKDANVNWAVELEPASVGVLVKLFDMSTGTLNQQATMPADLSGVGDARLTIHRISDQVVSWIGGVGMAATRIAFKNGKDGAIWRIDSDGANAVRVSPPGRIVLAAAWSPDGSWLAYSESRDALWVLYLQRISTGTRNVVPSSFPSNSYGPVFSPDGKTLVFAHGPAEGKSKGIDLESADVSRMCCAHRLTFSGALADNLSPTYSNDGRRIAFLSDRTGRPEIWVMDADGTAPSQPVPPGFDSKGHALDTYSPAWSPDGTKIAFSRDTDGGGRQIFYWSVGSGTVTQVTNSSRNEDASWAPDSRHVVFRSSRSGSDQLWIFDLVTSNSRQLTSKSATIDGTRLPSWSRTIGNNP